MKKKKILCINELIIPIFYPVEKLKKQTKYILHVHRHIHKNMRANYIYMANSVGFMGSLVSMNRSTSLRVTVKGKAILASLKALSLAIMSDRGSINRTKLSLV
jgi:hypothetical protein